MVAAHSPYFAGVRLRSIAGIWFRHALVLRHTWLPSLTWYFVEPFVILIAIGVGIGTLVEDIDGLPYARFVTPGVIAGSAIVPCHIRVLMGVLLPHPKGRLRDDPDGPGQHARDCYG